MFLTFFTIKTNHGITDFYKVPLCQYSTSLFVIALCANGGRSTAFFYQVVFWLIESTAVANSICGNIFFNLVNSVIPSIMLKNFVLYFGLLCILYNFIVGSSRANTRRLLIYQF